jgi:hypothetical protein
MREVSLATVFPDPHAMIFPGTPGRVHRKSGIDDPIAAARRLLH